MSSPESNKTTRRQFLATTAIATSAVLAAPAIVTAKKAESKAMIIGEGDYKYEVTHNWPQLPKEYSWQTTHNVAIDGNNHLYVIHEGNKKDHPTIFVFDGDGKFVRAFGGEFQGGGHGIEVRKEGSEEFLYICSYQDIKSVAKTTLKGETVWTKHAPMESGVYAEGEDKNHQKNWTRKGFLPTNIAFLDDGGFYLADGYGSYYIHRYDKDAKWVSKFGGAGKGKGKFALPHGIWIDRRTKDAPKIVICDREHDTLQIFDIDGKYEKTIKGFGWPANVDTYKDLLVVPELHARVSILNAKYEVVARLGDDVERMKKIGDLREHSDQWQDGKFVHPHDACFDAEGNIFVAEWVNGGRVSKLKRMS